MLVAKQSICQMKNETQKREQRSSESAFTELDWRKKCEDIFFISSKESVKDSTVVLLCAATQDTLTYYVYHFWYHSL